MIRIYFDPTFNPIDKEFASLVMLGFMSLLLKK